jgi:hypothetical protein
MPVKTVKARQCPTKAVLIQEHAIVVTKIPCVETRTDDVVADREQGDSHHDRNQYDHSNHDRDRTVALNVVTARKRPPNDARVIGVEPRILGVMALSLFAGAGREACIRTDR